MLFKYKPLLETKLEDILNIDLVSANKIVTISEDLTDSVQDYNLILDNGLEVVLHKENCADRKPQEGDYFYLCHNTFKYLWAPEDFEAIHELIE